MIFRGVEMLIVVLVFICHLIIDRWILEIAIALFFQILSVRQQHNWRRDQIRVIPNVHFRVSSVLKLLLVISS
jgi:hypothetical protein